MDYQTPLITSKLTFDDELELFQKFNLDRKYENKIFTEVAIPMFRLWKAWKSKNYYDCLKYVAEIKSDDWRVACQEWVVRRKDKFV